MLKKLTLALAATTAFAALPAAASPLIGSFSFNAESGDTPGPFNATASSFAAPTSTFTSYTTASFTYTGALDFSSTTNADDTNRAFFNSAPGANAANNFNISNYNGTRGTTQAPQSANFSTLANFLSSSGSASNYVYGSLYKIDLGTLAAGTDLIVTHDDGFSVTQNGTAVGTTTTGPTTAITETVALSQTADTILYYARENDKPSVLTVNVPEPVSLSLLGAGLLGLAGSVRRRRTNASAG